MRRSLSVITVLALFILARAAMAQQNPFMQLVKALTDQMSLPNSPFNGPDRGGPDTLHGEVEDHWFDGYDPPPWDEVEVPPWQDNTDPPVGVPPINPSPPGNVILINNDTIYSVNGKFLVGAIKWPHEEYLEQYVDGTITEIEDQHKVPVYWVAGWRLFIPEGYPADESKKGKALIVHAGGGNPIAQGFRPPWMVPMLENSDWRDAAAVKAALRLGVPVLYFGANPVAQNVFEENRSGLEQGGVAGYWGEARFDFSGHWSIKAPEADPIRDHPQFMYVASFIRARTFLEGFFNPAANGTTSWSKWDEITNNNTSRYTPMTDVTLAVCPHYALLAQLACAVDPALTDLTIIEPAACAAETTLDPNIDRRELEMDRNQLPALPASSAWAANLLRIEANR